MRRVMIGWVILLGWGLLAGIATGQQLSGAFSLTGTTGYQTNSYLDPVLGEWDPNTTPTFLAFDPSVALTYTAPSVQLGVRGAVRTYPRRVERSLLPLMRLSGSGQFTVASQWAVGLYGGGSRYRLNSERNTWWALPALAWSPGSGTTLEVRGGVAGRRNVLASGGTSRQTSAVGVLVGDTWFTDRWRGRMSLYVSNGRAAARTATYGGTGLTVASTYWWTDRLALTGHAAFEQVRYERTQEQAAGGDSPIGMEEASGGATTTTTTTSDRLWRVGAEVSWTLRSGVTLFTRAQGMAADLEASGARSFDAHVGGGVRWRIAHALAGSRRAARTRGLWHNEDEGLRFHIRYEGPGQLYVTGDFNDWADPGIPLRQVEPERYTAVLPLTPGRYEYRIRIVDREGETRWLAFPEGARTVRDGFGGVNGVCIVE